MSRAQAMAQGAKATLGSIQSIENQTPAVVVGPQPRLMAPAGSAPVETPVTPGTIEIRAQVLLTIAIH